MFCHKCGKKIDEEMKFCSNCGAENLNNKSTETALENNQVSTPQPNQVSIGEDRSSLGVLMALFLGFIGLLIGSFLCRTEYEKTTFMKGWGTTFLIVFLISIFGAIIYIAAISSIFA